MGVVSLVRRFVPLVALLLAWCLLPGRVAAHAHLVRADLAPDSHVLVRAGVYRFWFDEALNQALSEIVIRDAQGQQVDATTGALNPADDTELDVPLPQLQDGQYTVLWTSDSAQDGHILRGFYLFTVGGPGAAAPRAVSPAAITSPASPTLDATALAIALVHWLVLAASALWTGVLALELLVLLPARMGSGDDMRALTTEASRRTALFVRLGLLATLITSVAELEAQAYAAGGWSGTVSGAVLSAILQSHYGAFWTLRIVLAFLALLVIGPAGSGRASSAAKGAVGLPQTAVRPVSRLAVQIATALGLGYLLMLALSGHAAAVPNLVVTSVLLDFLHLLAMSVWIGGMAAIALLLLPAALSRGDDTRSSEQGWLLAFLQLLDRYSPAAVLAVGTAAVTGMFNAQVHLDSLQALTGTAYGRFLLIKLALVGELVVLSASHMVFSRPRLRAALLGTPRLPAAKGQLQVVNARAPGVSEVADRDAVGSGVASLAVRLRVEPLLGALILLCVAMMGQVAPSITVLRAPAAGAAAGATPAAAPAVSPTAETQGFAITRTARAGDLTVTLSVDPAIVGRVRLTAAVRENGKPVTDGQVRIKLSVQGNTSIGAAFVETSAGAGGYSGNADLVQNGQWQAVVLVRTRSDPAEFRPVAFEFFLADFPGFLRVEPLDTRFGSADVRLSQPSNAPDTLQVRLRPGLKVRLALSMESMPGMGTGYFDATYAGGWYGGQVNFPMAGLTTVLVQVQELGQWRTVRLLNYYADIQGNARFLPVSPVDATTQ